MVGVMTPAQPLAKVGAKVRAAAVPRRITLLGATGSIGSSTIDLLRRDPAHYEVEAVTAYRNGGALARQIGRAHV